MKKPTLAVIVGNRNFFADRLVEEGRKEVLEALAKMGVETVAVDEKTTKLGATETWADSQKTADLFKTHRDKIDGILVTLPNFGDELGIVDAFKLSGLKVPILVHAFPDRMDELTAAGRRDSFCGKISVCNNLRQAGIAYTLTTKHVVHPLDASFRSDLEKFVAVCRVVRGLRGVRIGAVGARPGAFNTVRYSEKILERHGISVTTVDLCEILGAAAKIGTQDARGREAGKRLLVLLRGVQGLLCLCQAMPRRVGESAAHSGF